VQDRFLAAHSATPFFKIESPLSALENRLASPNVKGDFPELKIVLQLTGAEVGHDFIHALTHHTFEHG
jgi:hypothetical protein